MYRTCCRFEKTRLVVSSNDCYRLIAAGIWRVDDSFETSLKSKFYVDYDYNTLNILTTKQFQRGSYINPAKELRPYITPRIES